MAANLIAKIDNLSDYKGILSVYDWSILTVSHYTDDDSAGVKITLVLEIPSLLVYVHWMIISMMNHMWKRKMWTMRLH